MSNTNNNLPTQTSSVLHNDTISSCSTFKLQEKVQLSKEGYMTGLKALQSHFTSLLDNLKDDAPVATFKQTFSQDMDLLEKQLTKEILHETNCKTALTELRSLFEITFNSDLRPHLQNYTAFETIFVRDTIIVQALNVDALKVDLVVIQDTCSEKEGSNSETTFNKPVKESSLNYETKDVPAIKYKMSKAKERCMTYFRSLHLHLQVLSIEDLKGTRIEHGFKRAFMSLFDQDHDTFTSMMLLNLDQLQKQLDKDEFQEDRSMTGFWVINRQFQKFIDSQFTLDYDSQMTDKYFAKYTRIKVKQFRETLLQHMSNVKKFVDERTQRSTTESEVQDENNRSRNDTDTDDADIRPIYDEEPMTEIQEKVFAIAALKNDLHKLKRNSVDTKFVKTSVLGKTVLQSLRNQSVVRQPNSFKYERPQMSKPRFASQVDVNNKFSRPVTQHYLPKRKESDFAKPDHMIASSSSRNSFKNMPRFSSNDMVHNHYLDKARKKTQERDRNSKLCVFNANHDACIIKFLKAVISRAKIQSNKTRNNNKLIDQKSHTQKPGRQIFKGYRFSPNKTSTMYEKTSSRSDLRWKPTGKIFKTVSLRWIHTGKIRASCTSKDDSDPTHGLNQDDSSQGDDAR
ncbi:hypothetical protein Tco_1419260 [Tanacetum coccineum]